MHLEHSNSTGKPMTKSFLCTIKEKIKNAFNLYIEASSKFLFPEGSCENSKSKLYTIILRK